MNEEDSRMLYLLDCLFTGARVWGTINIDKMVTVPPAILTSGSYKAVSGRVFKVDGNGAVVDDTDAWERGNEL